jgi:hypothetical protein
MISGIIIYIKILLDCDWLFSVQLGTSHKVKGGRGWAGKNRGWVTVFEHG